METGRHLGNRLLAIKEAGQYYFIHNDHLGTLKKLQTLTVMRFGLQNTNPLVKQPSRQKQSKTTLDSRANTTTPKPACITIISVTMIHRPGAILFEIQLGWLEA